MPRPPARRVALPLALAAALLAPAGVLAAELIGPDTCKACHPAAWQAWSESAHARALDGVPPARRKDGSCTSCHAPAAEAGHPGVTCEACHGGGRIYAHAYVMRDRELARAVGLVDPDERTCAACHTESAPSLRPFDYRRRLALIDHWTEERARRAGRSAPPAADPAPAAAKPPGAPAARPQPPR